MNDNIKSIYKQNINLLCIINRLLYYFRRQNYDAGLSLATAVISQLNELLTPLLLNASYFNENCELFDNDMIVRLLSSLLEAQKKRDYILLADIYEIQIIPFLISLQETIIGKEEFVFDEDAYKTNLETLKNIDSELGTYLSSLPAPMKLLEQGYSIEYSSGGSMTLAIEKDSEKFYLHSNYLVNKEAFSLASAWVSEDKSEYIIYGLGLGYHIIALNEVNSYVDIEVYESDINIIQLACAFSDFVNVLNKPNVKLVYDPEHKQLFKKLGNAGKESEFIIHYPSLRSLPVSAIKEKLENYFLQYSSIKNQIEQLNGNFNTNIKHYDGIVDELKEVFTNKDLFIIAAGPSLDKNYLQLKELNENSIILATGTVFRKLLNAGIKPDYIIVTDGNPRVISQIKDREDSDVPMLYLSTAHKGFAQKYHGKKYIIFQKDFNKSEEYAEKTGCNLYNTGGSVSTTALDIGITFRCKRIIFLGLDLAFTDNFVHATDSSRRELTNTGDLCQVEDINGNLIYTSRSLNIYREWIENRIRGVDCIEFIDATEGGAKIAGMKIKKLSECI